ncbi:MAG: hypothetical protein IPH20_24210 [Bacteroidales bacterium]|nr:hypothetical protein [Bacteroidales bacterium]
MLEWNYTPDQIGNSGTTLLDIDREVSVSFTAGFGNGLDSYLSGIKLNWKISAGFINWISMLLFFRLY